MILSTIPPSVRLCLGIYPVALTLLQILTASAHPLEDLFMSFWAAIDARVLNSLDRVAASAAFLSSVLESLTFFVRRLLNAPKEVVASLLRGDDEAQAADVDSLLKAFLRDQTVRTWEEVSSGRLKVRGKDAGECLAGTFSSLHKISPELFENTWDVLAGAVQKSIATDGDTSALVPEVLQQLSEQLEPGTPPGDSARALVVQVVRSALDQCSALLEAEDGKRERVVALVGILDAFGEHVFTDPEVAQVTSTYTLYPQALLTILEASGRSCATPDASLADNDPVTPPTLPQVPAERGCVFCCLASSA